MKPIHYHAFPTAMCGEHTLGIASAATLQTGHVHGVHTRPRCAPWGSLTAAEQAHYAKHGDEIVCELTEVTCAKCWAHVRNEIENTLLDSKL